MKLWIDDERWPPEPRDEWHWANTSEKAIIYLAESDDPFWYEEIAFDHDLGYNDEDGVVRDDTTRPVMLWMIENDVWPKVISIHTGNPIGRAWLKGMAERYAPEGTVIIG